MEIAGKQLLRLPLQLVRNTMVYVILHKFHLTGYWEDEIAVP